MNVRLLRQGLAAALRRAEAGERIVITVGGRPVAQLGPVDPPGADGPTLDGLAARGLVIRPRRSDPPPEAAVVVLPVGARLDRLLREVRGS